MTSLESSLFRLGFLEGGFYHLYNEFPKISEGKTFYSFKSLVREIAVIKLWNFLLVRQDLLKDLGILKKEIIDECLSPFWEPIYKNREGFKLLRNKYIAHMQEEKKPFKKTAEEILHETKLEISWNDITFYSGCALNYCIFIKANFQKEFESAREKYFKSVPLEGILPRSDIKHEKDPNSE